MSNNVRYNITKRYRTNPQISLTGDPLGIVPIIRLRGNAVVTGRQGRSPLAARETTVNRAGAETGTPMAMDIAIAGTHNFIG